MLIYLHDFINTTVQLKKKRHCIESVRKTGENKCFVINVWQHFSFTSSKLSSLGIDCRLWFRFTISLLLFYLLLCTLFDCLLQPRICQLWFLLLSLGFIEFFYLIHCFITEQCFITVLSWQLNNRLTSFFPREPKRFTTCKK